jgi:murein DD-endopeptidase MepM/ murein hydrolase activator NlpD
MALPIKNGKIGTKYGVPNHGSIKWQAGHHQGVDFPTPVGTPVYAVADGVVTGLGFPWGSGFGTHSVVIKHTINKKDYYTIYAHCSATHTRVGAKVKKGDLIAYSGAEGHVTGPHLHLECHTKPNWDITSDVNPQPLLDA